MWNLVIELGWLLVIRVNTWGWLPQLGVSSVYSYRGSCCWFSVYQTWSIWFNILGLMCIGCWAWWTPLLIVTDLWRYVANWVFDNCSSRGIKHLMSNILSKCPVYGEASAVGELPCISGIYRCVGAGVKVLYFVCEILIRTVLLVLVLSKITFSHHATLVDADTCVDLVRCITAPDANHAVISLAALVGSVSQEPFEEWLLTCHSQTTGHAAGAWPRTSFFLLLLCCIFIVWCPQSCLSLQ